MNRLNGRHYSADGFTQPGDAPKLPKSETTTPAPKTPKAASAPPKKKPTENPLAKPASAPKPEPHKVAAEKFHTNAMAKGHTHEAMMAAAQRVAKKLAASAHVNPDAARKLALAHKVMGHLGGMRGEETPPTAEEPLATARPETPMDRMVDKAFEPPRPAPQFSVLGGGKQRYHTLEEAIAARDKKIDAQVAARGLDPASSKILKAHMEADHPINPVADLGDDKQSPFGAEGGFEPGQLGKEIRNRLGWAIASGRTTREDMNHYLSMTPEQLETLYKRGHDFEGTIKSGDLRNPQPRDYISNDYRLNDPGQMEEAYKAARKEMQDDLRSAKHPEEIKDREEEIRQLNSVFQSGDVKKFTDFFVNHVAASTFDRFGSAIPKEPPTTTPAQPTPSSDAGPKFERESDGDMLNTIQRVLADSDESPHWIDDVRSKLQLYGMDWLKNQPKVLEKLSAMPELKGLMKSLGGTARPAGEEQRLAASVEPASAPVIDVEYGDMSNQQHDPFVK